MIQPGGSVKDQEVIDAANEHDMAMVFTGIQTLQALVTGDGAATTIQDGTESDPAGDVSLFV